MFWVSHRHFSLHGEAGSDHRPLFSGEPKERIYGHAQEPIPELKGLIADADPC